jgi:hypothetical protein
VGCQKCRKSSIGTACVGSQFKVGHLIFGLTSSPAFESAVVNSVNPTTKSKFLYILLFRPRNWLHHNLSIIVRLSSSLSYSLLMLFAFISAIKYSSHQLILIKLGYIRSTIIIRHKVSFATFLTLYTTMIQETQPSVSTSPSKKPGGYLSLVADWSIDHVAKQKHFAIAQRDESA